MSNQLSETLAILNVGHGNSAVLIDRDGIVVIDTGLGSTLSEFLLNQEIETLDVVLLSHADKDHIGGLIQILASDQFQVKRVRLNTDSLKDTVLWDDLLYELDLANSKNEIDFVPNLSRNSNGEFDQGTVHINVVAPSPYLASKGAGSTDRKGRPLNSNSLSAVIRLEANSKPFCLLPGDLDQVGLSNLLEDGVDFDAPVCVFPHHGGLPGTPSVSAFVDEFCTAVRPQTMIFSIGRGVHSTPRKDVVAAIQTSVKDIRIACTQLSKHCAEHTPGTRPPHLTATISRGAESRSCCSGTILISFAPPIVQPTVADHAVFIETHAPTALCKMKDGDLL